MAYSPARFEVATSSGYRGDAFTRKYIFRPLTLTFAVKVTLNVAQYPLHHVTYLGTKFNVPTSNGLGDVFTRKYII